MRLPAETQSSCQNGCASDMVRPLRGCRHTHPRLRFGARSPRLGRDQRRLLSLNEVPYPRHHPNPNHRRRSGAASGEVTAQPLYYPGVTSAHLMQQTSGDVPKWLQAEQERRQDLARRQAGEAREQQLQTQAAAREASEFSLPDTPLLEGEVGAGSEIDAEAHLPPDLSSFGGDASSTAGMEDIQARLAALRQANAAPTPLSTDEVS